MRHGILTCRHLSLNQLPLRFRVIKTAFFYLRQIFIHLILSRVIGDSRKITVQYNLHDQGWICLYPLAKYVDTIEN